MAFDQMESSAGDEYLSHSHSALNYSGDYKHELESDSVAGDGSCSNAFTSFYGGSCASDSAGLKGPDLSDSYTAVSSSYQRYLREPPRVVKAKSIRDLECEECLRRLHSLAVADSVYFRRGVLGMPQESDAPKPGDYVEGRVVCFSFDKRRRYVVITIEGYGFLKFTLGDLYHMTVDKNVCLQRLQQPGALAKSMKQKRQRLDYEEEYISRRGSNCQLGAMTEDSDTVFPREDQNYQSSVLSSAKNDNSIPEQLEVRTRPMPPGVEVFCKCRFINKVDLVRKLRAIINQNKQYFYEKTALMQELRLIMTQNIRAYELEMVAYLLEEDPWEHSANPYDRPSEDGIKAIIDQYREAVCSPEYVALFRQWQKYQKALKDDVRLGSIGAKHDTSPHA